MAFVEAADMPIRGIANLVADHAPSIERSSGGVGLYGACAARKDISQRGGGHPMS